MQLLFELWDRDGDGTVAFADVALAFRKFCPAMQRTQVTAADAVEVRSCCRRHEYCRGGPDDAHMHERSVAGLVTPAALV